MPAQRWLIWQLHLSAAYAIEQRLMEAVAALCASRADRFANAEGRAVINSTHLVAAVQRVYRKSGDICPGWVDAKR